MSLEEQHSKGFKHMAMGGGSGRGLHSLQQYPFFSNLYIEHVQESVGVVVTE